MRPRLLRLSAIGSFAGEVEIDFDALSPFGLFHIHGPTGAGKSSLLDGLCFALYGKVPPPRLCDGLRSHHARPSIEAKAELEFTAQGADYRIVRTPTQRRGKKSGVGDTEQRATAFLARHDTSRWVPVASGIKEVDVIVEELIGLDAGQFMQVVVLPQGGFQKVLRATADERAKLLTTLFDAERFDIYSARLKERAESLEREVLNGGARARGIAGRVRQVSVTAGIEIDWPAETHLDPAEHQLLKAASDIAHGRAQSAASLLAQAERNRDEANHLLRSRTLENERYSRKVAAQQQLEILQKDAPAIDQARRELSAARRVERILPLIQRLNEATGEAKSAAERRRSLQEVVVMALQHAGAPVKIALSEPPALNHDELRPEALKLTQTRLQQLATSIKSGLDQFNRSRLATLDARKHAERIETLSGELRSAQEVVAETQNRIATLEENGRKLQAKSSRLSDLTKRRVDLENQLSAAEEWSEASKSLGDKRAEAIEAQKAAVVASHEHLKLFQQRLDGIAAELSGRLVDGEPCIVCGSLDHPHIATPLDTAISADDVEAALSKADSAKDLARSLESACDELAKTTESLLTQAGARARDLPGARKALVDLSHEESGAQSAQTELAELQSSLGTLSESSVPQQELVSHLQLAISAQKALASTRKTEAEELQGAILEQFGADPDLSELDDQVSTLLENLHELSQAVANHDAATQRQASEQERTQSAMKEIGETGIDDVEQLGRSKDQQEVLAQRIDVSQAEMEACRTVLAEVGMADLKERPDISGTELLAAQAADKYAEALTQHSQAYATADELAEAVGSFAAELSALGPVAARAERVRQLSNLCNGVKTNDKRLSLGNYVLAAYLEEVAAAASQRLSLMTSGRFALRHSDARVRGNGASGLSLLVSDAYTGVEREVSTLSGGETFLASLALALGLADVVQSHAGGVHIEALFIDEGFGSLDAEALDLAMVQLDRLREGGRIVGIISHVEALRERIPAGVEVVPGFHGSTLKVSGPLDQRPERLIVEDEKSTTLVTTA